MVASLLPLDEHFTVSTNKLADELYARRLETTCLMWTGVLEGGGHARGALSEQDGRCFMCLLDMCHFLVDRITRECRFKDLDAAGMLRTDNVMAAAALTGKMYTYWDAAPAGPGIYEMLLQWTAENSAQSGSLSQREVFGRRGGRQSSGQGQAMHLVAMNECSHWPRQRVSGVFSFAAETEAGAALLVDNEMKTVYEVLGISKSIGDIVRGGGNSPLGASVRLTLLPFMGVIIYDAHVLGGPPSGASYVAEAKAVCEAALAAGTVLKKLPEPPPLLGKRVTISGLVSKPEVNGARGVAYEFSEAKGRYAVRLEAGGAPMLLKPANLEQLPPRVSAAPGEEGVEGREADERPLDAFEKGARAKLKKAPALVGHGGAWTVRRMGYTEADNPTHEACIISGEGGMVMAGGASPLLGFAQLAPTSAEYLKGLLSAVAANGGKRPHMIAVDEQSAVARLQTVLGPAGIRAGYYPPPSDEELSTMGGPAAAGVNDRVGVPPGWAPGM